jgi:hypothetical protein
MTIIAIILVNIIFSFDYKVKQENRVVSSDTKLLASYLFIDNIDYTKETITLNRNIKKDLTEVETEEVIVEDILIEEDDNSELEPEIVYEDMTLEQLGDKLDRSLKSTLSGYGYIVASYAIEYDVDPYLAVAIMLHETGCSSGKCSTLVTKCNNVGGMKGSPSCGSGSYKRFNTLDEGIEAFMKNLSKNYIKKGLTTPEAINTKYAASSSWSEKVKYYINKIRNN